MDTYLILQSAIEKAADGYKLSALKKISDELTQKYKAEREDGTKLISSREEALVYAIVRMPATYSAVLSALNHTLPSLNEEIKTVLDVGAGTGAAFWAASEVLQISAVDCIEREREMISLGKQLAESGAGVSANWINADILSFQSSKKYDLVIASYALNEMSPTVRQQVLEKLWACTEKLLLIIEPGTPHAFAIQQELRARLKSRGAALAAPCPNGAECQSDWCHFTCRVPRSKLHKAVKGADAPFEDEKFTYSAFTKSVPNKFCYGRVLRHPVTQEKKITLQICLEKGIETKTLFKKDGAPYKKAKKLKAGDEYEKDGTA